MSPHLPELAIALREQLARQLAMRLRNRPEEERVRPLRLPLDDKTAQILYQAGVEEAQLAWAGVEALEAEGLVRIEFKRRKARFSEPWHRDPKLHAEPGAFERLAELGSVAARDTTPQELAKRLMATGTWSEETALAITRGAPAAVMALGLEGALTVLQRIRTLAQREPALYLREASAALFEARSKVFDGREHWLSQLLAAPCPWRAHPVYLEVVSPTGVAGEFVFVENQITFERLAGTHERFPGAVFVYSAGFKAAGAHAAAGRAKLFFDTIPADPHEHHKICRALLSPGREESCELPTAFFGDLDYAGMAILKSLRRAWPQMVAWKPGYESLAELLSQGIGHTPEESEKAEQRDPGNTGCLYSDHALLPLLRAKGQFVDQEAFEWRKCLANPSAARGL